MPVATSELTDISRQAGGGVRVTEVHTDALGVTWRHSYLAASEAAATAVMGGRDLASRLKDRDFLDLLKWVQRKNTVASFGRTNRDITELEGEVFIATWFAGRDGGHAITVAWWVESLGPPAWAAIADRIGYSAQQRSDVQNRAIDLSAAAARFDLTVKTP